LISHRFPIERGEEAYKLISGETKEPYLGIVLEYDGKKELETDLRFTSQAVSKARVRVGMIGAGSYAKKFLLPNLKSCKAEFCSIATASGVTAHDVAKQYGFAAAASEARDVIGDPYIESGCDRHAA